MGGGLQFDEEISRKDLGCQCPLWVISGHCAVSGRCDIRTWLVTFGGIAPAVWRCLSVAKKTDALDLTLG